MYFEITGQLSFLVWLVVAFRDKNDPPLPLMVISPPPPTPKSRGIPFQSFSTLFTKFIAV
jgi:hypothetical protein